MAAIVLSNQRTCLPIAHPSFRSPPLKQVHVSWLTVCILPLVAAAVGSDLRRRSRRFVEILSTSGDFPLGEIADPSIYSKTFPELAEIEIARMKKNERTIFKPFLRASFSSRTKFPRNNYFGTYPGILGIRILLHSERFEIRILSFFPENYASQYFESLHG